MLDINHKISADDLTIKLQRLWELSGEKILSIENMSTPDSGTPVFTVEGKYTSQGYSTVTLFARFRGLSTSQPRRTAMW
jgi:hypothetical protein